LGKEINEQDYILNCKGISKAFGGTQALKGVQLHVKPGEVHALLGENGAGKSTLMKIVIGLYQQDAGTMTFDGQPYQAKGPVDAINSGISMIHQELNPEPHMTIAESIFLNREDTKGIFLDKKKQNERTQKILDDFGFPYPATTMIRDLKLADVQMVEIIRAVTTNAKLIIMDEPTSSLDEQETQHLFRVIRDLKKDGVAVSIDKWDSNDRTKARLMREVLSRNNKFPGKIKSIKSKDGRDKNLRQIIRRMKVLLLYIFCFQQQTVIQYLHRVRLFQLLIMLM
jgi:ABC-type sugar transport system ATPase subunit